MSMEIYLCGHGNWLPEYGSFEVPYSVRFKFYVKDGKPFDDGFEMSLLRDIPLEWCADEETITDDYRQEVIESLKTCKNYRVHHPAGLKISRKRETATEVKVNETLQSIKDKDYLYVERGKSMQLNDIAAKLPPGGEERLIHCLFCRDDGEAKPSWAKDMVGKWDAPAAPRYKPRPKDRAPPPSPPPPEKIVATSVLPCQWTLSGQVVSGVPGRAPAGKIKISTAYLDDLGRTTLFKQTVIAGGDKSPVERLLDGQDPGRLYLSAKTLDGRWSTAASAAVEVKKGEATTAILTIKPIVAPMARVAAEVDFGSLQVGEAVTKKIAIENAGDAPLVISRITFPPPFAEAPGNLVKTDHTIAATQRAEVEVVFRPDAVGAKSGNLTILSNDPADEPPTVVLKGEAVQPEFELFRGTQALGVVPFSPTDVAAELDFPLEDAAHNDATAARPTGPAFAFPKADSHLDVPQINGNPSVFRLRMKNVPASFAAPELRVTLKVLTAAGKPIEKVATDDKNYTGTASHGRGMTVVLKKGQDGNWESPYLRVATTFSDHNRDPAWGVVHSLPPIGSKDVEATKQFGRKLRVEALDGKPVTKDFILGGKPFARIPVKFVFVAKKPPVAVKLQFAWDKLHNLNQYWAAQGLEFVFVDPNTPLQRAPPPSRTLIAIGDYTGRALVSESEFTLTISLAIALKGQPAEKVDIAVAVQARKTPGDAADAIKAAIAGWTPAADGKLAGLKLDADKYDIQQARLYIEVDSPLQTKSLRELGVRGPTDVVIRQAAGNGVALEERGLQIGGIKLTTAEADAKKWPDIYAPPVENPYHDGAFLPPAGTTRHWARTYSPPNKTYFAVVIESGDYDSLKWPNGFPHQLCQKGFATLYDADEKTIKSRFASPMDGAADSVAPAQTLLNYGIWNDASAKFILYINDSRFKVNYNDLQHEMGHGLADLNHTIVDPGWAYDYELMHSNGPTSEAALRMTNHKIYVTALINQNGWKSFYKECARGYGAAARARIQQEMSKDWVVGQLDPGQPAWQQ